MRVYKSILSIIFTSSKIVNLHVSSNKDVSRVIDKITEKGLYSQYGKAVYISLWLNDKKTVIASFNGQKYYWHDIPVFINYAS